MSLSCTVSEILSLVWQHLKRSRDSEHIPFGGSISCMHEYSYVSISTRNLKCFRTSSIPKIWLGAYSFQQRFYEKESVHLNLSIQTLTTPDSSVDRRRQRHDLSSKQDVADFSNWCPAHACSSRRLQLSSESLACNHHTRALQSDPAWKLSPIKLKSKHDSSLRKW